MGKRDKKQRHQPRKAAFHYLEEDEGVGDGHYEGHSLSKHTLSEEEEEEEEEEVDGKEEADEYPSNDLPSKFLLYQQSVQV